MSSPVWLIGVGLAVVSAIISNLGLNLQKRNHLNNSNSAAEKHKAHKGAGKRRASSSHHHKDGSSNNHTTAAAAGPTQANRERADGSKGRRNRVQPSDILIRHSSNGSNAIESGGEEQSAVKRVKKKKKKWSAAAGQQVAADSAPLLETINGQAANGGVAHSAMNGRYSGLADESLAVDNMQDLLSASSSFLVQPPSGHGTANTTASSNSNISTAVTNARHTACPSPVPSTASSAHNHKNADDAAASINYTRQLTWQCGLALVIVGSLFDFAALAFASQSLIAPLGSLTLVSNVFLAPLLLKEKLSRRDVVCTLVIVVGAALAVSCASHDDSTQSVSAMFSNFLRIQFIAYAALVVLSVVVLRVITWKAAALRKRAHTSREAAKRYQAGMKYHRFGYAAAAGIMGAQSVLFAKCTSTLFRTMIAGDGVMFVYPGTYGVLLGLGVTIFFQIRWLNSGLRLFPALYVVPVFQSFWILVSVISGMVFFQEYHGVLDQPLQACGFCFGIFLTIGGVYVLSQKAGQDGPQESASDAMAADDAEASLDKAARRHSLSSSSSSFEPQLHQHPRSRSISGDSADFIVHIDQAHTPGSALKQPLLVDQEEKQAALFAAHSAFRTPAKSGKRSQMSSSPNCSLAAPLSSAAAKSPFVPSSHPHHLSPLPEQLSPDSHQQRSRVDSDPVRRQQRDGAGGDDEEKRSGRGALYPPPVQLPSSGAVLPSHSFSHANEFLSAAPPSPPRRTRSASIGHIGDDWQPDSRRSSNRKKAPNFNFQQALAALVSPPVQPLEASPHFRKQTWHEISRNAAMTAPGLSAFAHAFALRNYERNEGESPDDTEDTDDSAEEENEQAAAQSDYEDETDDDEEGDDEDEDDEDEDGDQHDDELKEADSATDAATLHHSLTAPASFLSSSALSASSRSSPRTSNTASPLVQSHTVRVPNRRVV